MIFFVESLTVKLRTRKVPYEMDNSVIYEIFILILLLSIKQNEEIKLKI